MSNQITCCMHFFTDPKQAQLGHLVKRHTRCVLNNNKLKSVLSPGVHRASKLQLALWRKMVECHHVAWGASLDRREKAIAAFLDEHG